MKKAFIVEYNIRTRVVVEVPDEVINPDGSYLEEFEYGVIHRAAQNKILNEPSNYVIYDNMVEMNEDEEVPYNPEFDEPRGINKVLLPDGSFLTNERGDIATFTSLADAKIEASKYVHAIAFIDPN